MFNSLTIVLFLSLFNFAHAAGPGTSGGGEGSRAEFYYLGDILFGEFEKTHITSKDLNQARRAYAELRKKEKNYPEFTEKLLSLDGQTVTAINDYDDFTILVNERRWNHSSFSQKRLLIIHELLGLARKYDRQIDDSKYAISGSLMAQLEKTGQKNFLLNSDYPPHFTSPELTDFTGLALTDITIARAATPTGLASATAEPCKVTRMEPSISFTFKREDKSFENKYSLAYSILCEQPNGKIYGHRQGQNEIGVFDLLSNNLLEMNSDIGSFIMGWVSGKNLLVRAPMLMIKLSANKDSTFNFEFEYYETKNGPAERLTGILKKK